MPVDPEVKVILLVSLGIFTDVANGVSVYPVMFKLSLKVSFLAAGNKVNVPLESRHSH